MKDAIMLNADGNVTEATAANIFLLRDGVLSTPSLDQGVLEGVTRNTILKIAREMGIPTRECVVPRFDLYIADEVFLTGTGAEVMPISEIDRRTVGTGAMGPTTRKLLTAFHKLARGN
jgi:branched-chain amino acid aminotransferase